MVGKLGPVAKDSYPTKLLWLAQLVSFIVACGYPFLVNTSVVLLFKSWH
jgi:hypothetical protein